jgi:hypothetical protein
MENIEKIIWIQEFTIILKNTRTNGNAPNGLYNYSFAIYNDPFDFQPSGAMN